MVTPPATIALSRAQIKTVLPLVRAGLSQYLDIRNTFLQGRSTADPTFRRMFNHFYRVRRAPPWQDVFYGELEAQKATVMGYREVLGRIHEKTGRVEASFASKLVATVDPQQPVIDAVVLNHAGLRLRVAGTPRARLDWAAAIHRSLAAAMAGFLASEDGRYLVAEFERRYPDSGVTEIKMLDLVLWQTR